MSEIQPQSCENIYQNMRLCRTCLAADDLMDLFADPDINRRKEQLTTVTGVKISLNDGLPQKICNTCSKVIDSAVKLRETSACTEKMLLQYGFIYNEQKLLMINESSDVKIKEEYGDYQHYDDKNKVKHEQSSLSDPSKSSSCTQQHNMRKVSAKRKAKLNKTISGISTSSINKTDGRKRKSKCTNSMKVGRESIKHYKTDKDRKAVDENSKTSSLYSDEKYNIFFDAKIDNLDAKEATTKVTKSETVKKTKKSPGLRQRVKKLKTFWSLAVEPVERNEMVQCKICEKLIKYQNFTGHAATHFEPEFTCEVCGLKLMSKKNLADHQQRKHGATKNFACAQCDYQCVCRADLQNHIRRVHTGERPFVCDLCSETFYQRRCLAAHMKCHFAVRKYQCDRCSKMFKSQGQLTAHYNRYHIMRYTFYCDHCSYQASGSSKVRDHLTKVHGITRDKQTPVKFVKERREESQYRDTSSKDSHHLIRPEELGRA